MPANWSAEDLAAAGYGADGRRIETRAPQPRNAALMPVKTPAVGAAVAPAGGKPATNKYHATRTMGPAPWGGEVLYPSARHARYAQQCAADASVVAWNIEVPLAIGIGPRRWRRHRVDFMLKMATGEMRLVECKGFDHQDGKSRRADLEAMGWTVEVVK